MTDDSQKLSIIRKICYSILLIGLIGCGSEEVVVTRTPRPVSTISELFGVQPTSTPQHTPTPFPTLELVTAVTQTPTLTTSETAEIATRPNISSFIIYDDQLHADWSLDDSTVNYDVTHEDETFRGVYALEVERDLNVENGFVPLLQMNLLSEATRSFPVDEIDTVSLWIYSGNGSLGVRDISLGVVLSTEPFPSDSAIVNVMELELTLFGLEEAIQPDTWVQLRYSPQELVVDETFAYLTGIYIENNVGFTQTILVDAVEITFLADEQVWQSAELVAITP